MKKLIDEPENVVKNMLDAMTLVNPNISCLSELNVIFRKDIDQVKSNQVSVVCGGGSGHEPSFAGFVGSGLLSAAVCGEVFSSPSVRQVHECIRKVTSKEKGILLIIMNYTGDRLNFGTAAELARAEGYNVSMLVVSDDCAILPSDRTAGRRGIAGTVLVIKAACASASEGKPLSEVYKIATKVAESVRTMGVALGNCVNPQSGQSSFKLEPTEIEMGLGIHGEPGVRKETMKSCSIIVEEIIDKVVIDAQLKSGDSVIVLLNNLGGTTIMETSIATLNIFKSLQKRGIKIDRFISGVYMSSLEMPGISISLLKVDSPSLLQLIDATTDSYCEWKAARTCLELSDEKRFVSVPPPTSSTYESPPLSEEEEKIKKIFDSTVSAVCNMLIEKTEYLTELDSAIGDGDIGFSLRKGAQTILSSLSTLPFQSPSETFRMIAHISRSDIGGSSGPLYGIFFLSFARSLSHSPSLKWNDISLTDISSAFEAGVKGLSELGGAVEGDKTMLDALFAASRSLELSVKTNQPTKESLLSMVNAAKSGAEATKEMTSRKGRSSYLGDRSAGHLDPGAVAVALQLEEIVKLYLSN